MPELSPTRYFVRFGAALLGVLLAVWAYVLIFPMGFLESGYPSWVAKETMLDECRLGRISFFGDSRVEAGIVPAALPVEASNLGVAAGTPIEVYAAVQHTLQCEHLPNYVVISLSANDFGPLSQFFWINSLRYGFVDRRYLREIEQTADRLGDDVTLSRAKTADGLSGWLRDWLYAAHFPTLYFSNLAQGQLFRRYASNRERLAAVLRDRGFVSYGGSGRPPARQRPEMAGTWPGRTPLHTVYFERTLQLLRDRGIAVGLLLTPVRQSGMPVGEPEKAHAEYLKSITRRFSNVQLINEQHPFWPASLFADGQHLSAEGARIFTTRLAGCVVGTAIHAGCDLDWHPEDRATALLRQSPSAPIAQ